MKLLTYALASSILSLLSSAMPSLAVPATPDPQMQQQFAIAQKLFESKRKPEAQKILLQLCKSANASPEMRVLLADTYLDLSGVDEETPGLKEAESGLQKAAQQEPDWGRPYKDMAEFCNLREQFSAAIEYCNKALQAKRPEIHALRQRAMAYSHLGKNKEALADITQYIESGHNFTFNYILKGDFEKSLKNYAAAEKSYFYVLTRTKTNRTRLLRSWVECIQAEKKYDDGIKVLNMAIQQDPTNSDNYELRGNLNMLAGKPQAALSDMTKAISLFPNSRYYKDRASIYRAMGQNEAAEADLKKAASSNVDMKDLLKGF